MTDGSGGSPHAPFFCSIQAWSLLAVLGSGPGELDAPFSAVLAGESIVDEYAVVVRDRCL